MGRGRGEEIDEEVDTGDYDSVLALWQFGLAIMWFVAMGSELACSLLFKAREIERGFGGLVR